MTEMLGRIAGVARTLDAVGHGVRGPLQIMRNLLFLLDEHPDRAERYASLLDEQARLLADHVDALARLGLGVRVPVRAPADVGALVRDLAGPAVAVEVSGDAQAAVDAAQVAMAAGALLRNAVEAAAPVRISVQGAPADVTIAVRDGGTWTPPEPIEIVYDPFYSTKGRALGLGLPVAYSVAVGHGGAIDIRPSSEGTTVTLRIPREQP